MLCPGTGERERTGEREEQGKERLTDQSVCLVYLVSHRLVRDPVPGDRGYLHSHKHTHIINRINVEGYSTLLKMKITNT